MKKVILEIDPLWQEIADDSPESLNGRSVNKNSYATGVIGELAVSQALASLGIGHSNDDTYDYDFLIEGIKVDVKTTNFIHGKIKEDNHFMLTNYLRNQQCEAYIVAAINYPENSVYIMGCCAKFWFWETGAAKDYKKGEQIFKKPIREDARNMKFKHLTSIYELPLLLEALK
tara:strand:+ start:1138 stop:1656 length:519 start_codon:yes stop_codon:yes gene_type:complete